MQKIVLSKTYSFEGKEYTELTLDFDSLTGRDVINAEKEARILGDNTPLPEFSKTYQAVLAAKAAKVSVDMLMSLNVRDFTLVTLMVQDFLLEEPGIVGNAVVPQPVYPSKRCSQTSEKS